MIVSLIVPVFNEEETIPTFHDTVRRQLSSFDVEIVFVNDGSGDATEQIIDSLARTDPKVISLSFTRNFGKEAALMAGLEHASGDAVIPIDVDLQDPIEVIPDMIDRWQDGADVVLAKRVDRSSDQLLKRKTAQWYYRLHNRISSIRIEENVGDFRLLSREVVENIKRLPEKNLFMKGVLSWVGGDHAIIEYTREQRVAGTSKFSGWRLWNFALEGITGFSTAPLRVWTYVGLLVALCAFFFGAWMIIEKLAFGNDVPGYPSLMVVILFLGGVQLICLGVLGEYTGRIYLETKARPRYILKQPLRRKIVAKHSETK